LNWLSNKSSYAFFHSIKNTGNSLFKSLKNAFRLFTILFFSWDSIQMELARNKSEHTTEEFGKRLESAANVTTDASNLERLNRWSCALQMFEERPIFGFGPGTYAFQYARFQEPEKITIISTNFGDAGNAHSEYLGPLSEMGVFGLLSMIFIVSAIFYKGMSSASSCRNSTAGSSAMTPPVAACSRRPGPAGCERP